MVPQWQVSKGSLIVNAALELRTNQIIHLYSQRKNSAETIKLIQLIRKTYKGYRQIYLSWDAAPWHDSRELLEEVDFLNGLPPWLAETGVGKIAGRRYDIAGEPDVPEEELPNPLLRTSPMTAASTNATAKAIRSHARAAEHTSMSIIAQPSTSFARSLVHPSAKFPAHISYY